MLFRVEKSGDLRALHCEEHSLLLGYAYDKEHQRIKVTYDHGLYEARVLAVRQPIAGSGTEEKSLLEYVVDAYSIKLFLKWDDLKS